MPTLSRLGKIECRMRMGFNKILRSQTTRNSGGEMKQSTYSGESKKHTANLHSGTEITLLKCRGNPQTRTHRPEGLSDATKKPRSAKRNGWLQKQGGILEKCAEQERDPGRIRMREAQCGASFLERGGLRHCRRRV